MLIKMGVEGQKAVAPIYTHTHKSCSRFRAHTVTKPKKQHWSGKNNKI